MCSDGRESERVFRAHHASLMAEDTPATAIEDRSEPHG